MNITVSTLRQAKIPQSSKKNTRLWKLYSFLYNNASYSEQQKGLVCKVSFNELSTSLGFQIYDVSMLLRALERKELIKRFRLYGAHGGVFVFIYPTNLLVKEGVAA